LFRFALKELFVPLFTAVDWFILLLYLAFVVGIGYALHSRIKISGDFLLAGRSMPGWACSLAFIAASLGAPEVIGMGAWGARYGLQAARFYAIGAIPAMLFAGLFLVPVYYGSKARSLPEFLGLRFDARSRVLNACAVMLMAIFSSAISLLVMAKAIQTLHLFDLFFSSRGWNSENVFAVSVVFSAVVVLAYLLGGGLAGAIYNQAIQFAIFVAAFLPVVMLGLRNLGGWSGLKATLTAAQLGGHSHIWQGATSAGSNSMGIGFVGLVLGVGVVLGAGCWCTDFRVMQTAMAAKDADSARRVPLAAAVARVLLPFLVILPGLMAVSLPTPHTTIMVQIEDGTIIHTTNIVRPAAEAGRGVVAAKADPATGKPILDGNGRPILDYNLATPNVLLHYLPSGLLGLAFTALLAVLMAGVAANATALNTVFTYDLYPRFRRKETEENELLAVGRWVTVGGLLLSVAAAFAVNKLHGGVDGIMATILLGISFLSAPFVAAYLVGIFWKRATGHGAFCGMIAGLAAAVAHHGLTLSVTSSRGLGGGWIAAWHHYPSLLAQSVWTAIAAFVASLLITVLVSLMTRARKEEELVGLVYSLSGRANRPEAAWWKRPETLAAAILLVTVVLNIIFA
jgi:SSS family solute:Na+ symporter